VALKKTFSKHGMGYTDAYHKIGTIVFPGTSKTALISVMVAVDKATYDNAAEEKLDETTYKVQKEKLEEYFEVKVAKDALLLKDLYSQAYKYLKNEVPLFEAVLALG